MSYQPTVPLDDAQRLKANAAVSWGAILAGAVAAISLTIILLVLGSGLGFAAVSPWANRGASATTVAVSGAIWLIVTQWLSSAVGGYLTGRMRHRWLGTHQHEVFFRDTAHGLVTWSVATLVVVLAASSSLSSLGSGLAHAGGAAAGLAAQGGMEAAHGAAMSGPPGGSMMPGAGPGPDDDHMYGVEKLFRAAPAAPSPGRALGRKPPAPPVRTAR